MKRTVDVVIPRDKWVRYTFRTLENGVEKRCAGGWYWAAGGSRDGSRDEQLAKVSILNDSLRDPKLREDQVAYALLGLPDVRSVRFV